MSDDQRYETLGFQTIHHNDRCNQVQKTYLFDFLRVLASEQMSVAEGRKQKDYMNECESEIWKDTYKLMKKRVHHHHQINPSNEREEETREKPTFTKAASNLPSENSRDIYDSKE